MIDPTTKNIIHDKKKVDDSNNNNVIKNREKIEVNLDKRYSFIESQRNSIHLEPNENIKKEINNNKSSPLNFNNKISIDLNPKPKDGLVSEIEKSKENRSRPGSKFFDRNKKVQV